MKINNVALCLMLSLVCGGCATIKQSKDVAIVLDASNGNYVPTDSLSDKIPTYDHVLAHELATLSENIYLDNKPYAKDMLSGCSNKEQKLPIPASWKYITSHIPKKPDNWYTWRMSGGMK